MVGGCCRRQAEESQACPLCFKLVHGRAPKVSRKRPQVGSDSAANASVPDKQQPRTERARRWDHLRKIHGITTCDKCSLRLHKDAYYDHSLICTSGEPEGATHTHTHRSDDSAESHVGQGQWCLCVWGWGGWDGYVMAAVAAATDACRLREWRAVFLTATVHVHVP